MGKTKVIVETMRCVNLAGELGKVLGVNPVWEDKYVVYGLDDDYEDELDDDYIQLAFDLENGRWVIVTDDYFIDLPKDAPDLMAGMSETIEETEDE